MLCPSKVKFTSSIPRRSAFAPNSASALAAPPLKKYHVFLLHASPFLLPLSSSMRSTRTAEAQINICRVSVPCSGGLLKDFSAQREADTAQRSDMAWQIRPGDGGFARENSVVTPVPCAPGEVLDGASPIVTFAAVGTEELPAPFRKLIGMEFPLPEPFRPIGTACDTATLFLNSPNGQDESLPLRHRKEGQESGHEPVVFRIPLQRSGKDLRLGLDAPRRD